jgi:CheY-like chemotaxis protein
MPGDDFKVLVVDDDDTILDLHTAILERLGVRFVATTHPEKALSHLREGGFQVLITDNNMPGMGGCELIATARREHVLPAKTIMVTGMQPKFCSSDCTPNQVILKPFTPAMMRSALIT